MEMNAKQYNQAENTPFGSGPLADLFGPDGTTQFSSDFLAGALVPPEVYDSLTPETQQILDVLQSPSSLQLPTIPNITPEQFSARYKKVDEATSSSYSNHHVGHNKAAGERPILSWIHANTRNTVALLCVKDSDDDAMMTSAMTLSSFY